MMTNLIICSFLLSVSLLQCVVGDTFYIVTSPQSACPDNYTEDACLTLDEFATRRVSSLEITLEMQPGNHSLGSQGLRVETKILFKMHPSISGAMANIVCTNATEGYSFFISDIPDVVVKGITFSQCGQIAFQAIGNLEVSEVSFSNCLDRINVNNIYQNARMTSVSLSHCQTLFVSLTTNFTFQNSTVVASTRTRSDSTSTAAATIMHITYGGNVVIAGSLFTPNVPDTRSLEIDRTPSAVISNCTFYNHSGFQGGALRSINSIVTINQSVFIHNSVTCQGGAVYTYLSSLTVHNSTFLNNRVGNSFGYYCSGGAIFVENSSLAISDSTFEHNSADRNDGGAVCNYHGDSLVVTDSRFHSNQVNDRGGALCSTNSTTIERSVFSRNWAMLRDGGAVYVSGPDIFIRESIFADNSASGAGGGAIHSTAMNIEISDSTFTSNSAPYCGVLFADSDSSISIGTSTFQSNRATTGDKGGGVACITDSRISVFNSSFRQNSAELNGGVFVIEGSTVDITSSNFFYNHATERGGVFDISDNTVLVIHSANIFNNTANHGGVISACNSEVTVPGNDGLIKHSEGSDSEGCILYDDANTTVTSTTTTENIQTTSASRSTTIPPASHSRSSLLPYVLGGVGGVAIVTLLTVVFAVVLAVCLFKSMRTKTVSDSPKKPGILSYSRLSEQEVIS